MAAIGIRRTVLVSFVFLALCLGLYVESFDNPFVNWDDYSLITQNEYIRSLSWSNLKAIFTPGEVGAYQPIRNVSYAIDYAIWQDNTLGYHLTNVIFYGLTVALLFMLFSTYLGNYWAAFVGALLFAVHPVHVEPVAWLSGRKDALAGFFFVLSILLYAVMDKPGISPSRKKWYYSGSFVAFMLSVLSKPTAVTLPALIVLHDMTYPPGAGFRLAVSRWRRYFPFFAVAAAMTAVTIVVGAQGDVVKSFHGGSPYSQVLTIFYVIARNVRLLFLPVELSARYVDYYATSLRQFEVVVSLIFVLFLILFTAVMWTRSRIASFGVLWFAVTLAPVLNLVPISTLVADRYLYLPSAGFALLVGLAFRGLLSRLRGISRALPSAAACALLFAFGCLTVNRTSVWSDNLQLWGDVVRKDPGNVFGHYAFANVYFEAGMYEKAGNEYGKTIRLAPDFPSAWIGLGNSYLLQDSLDTAIEVYEQALTYCSGEQSGLLVNLGNVLRAKGEHDKAIVTFRDALVLDPESEKARLGLARSYLEKGEFEAAVAQYNELIDIEPKERIAVVYHNMALAYSYKRDYEKAIEYLRMSLSESPEFVEARFALANCYRTTGELDEAAAHLRQILAVYPADYRALNNLWSVYTAMGMKSEALSALEEAAAIAPDDLTIRNNLAATYIEMGRLSRAEEILKGILADHGDSAPARLNLGVLLAARGAHEEALVQYREALLAMPDSPEAYYNIACSQARLGLRPEAVTNLKKALDLGFDRPELLQTDPDLEALRSYAAFTQLARATSNRPSAPRRGLQSTTSSSPANPGGSP